MKTIVLGTDESDNAVAEFLKRLDWAQTEVRDSNGRLIAVVEPVWEFGDPNLSRALGRRGGKTTQQLLDRLNAIPLPSKPCES